jgi:threonine/homoserine/homoserine lactone efflux protein
MAKIVQDGALLPVVSCGHGQRPDPDRAMSELLGLAGFTLVGSITPGPNNALLLASGTRFGFLRTAPHVAGTALGMAALVLAVAGGVGVVLLAVPGAGLALKLAGSAYLLWLALGIARARGGKRAAATRPLRVLQAAAFQFANPKAWLFVLAAVGAFLPPNLAPAVAALAVATVIAVVVLATAAVWAAGGAALRRVLDDQRLQRPVAIVLAVLLAASVAFIWV